MLKLTVKFDIGTKGVVSGMTLKCNVPRPSCSGCKFKTRCDSLIKKVKKIDILED
jgi:hypothetical protein